MGNMSKEIQATKVKMDILQLKFFKTVKQQRPVTLNPQSRSSLDYRKFDVRSEGSRRELHTS